MLRRLTDPFPGVRFWGGFGSFAARGIASSGGGAPATGPASWDPWGWWDADLSVSSGQATWTDQVNGWALNETGAIALNSSDANWNNHDSLELDGSSDYYELDTTDVPLADQRFLHDGTEYDARLTFRPTGGGAVRRAISSADEAGSSPDTGLYFQWDESNERLIARIYNAATVVAVVASPNGSVPSGASSYVAWRVEAGELKLSVNGAPWVTDSLGTAATGDASFPLRIGQKTGCTVTNLFISKTLATSSRQAEQLDYYLGQTNSGETNTTDGWVAQWPVSADGLAITADDVAVTSGDVTGATDQTGNGNHLTDAGAGNRPSLDSSTYSEPVIDFDGVSEYLVMPTGPCSAMTGSEDQPYTMGALLRATNTLRIFAEIGQDGTDYPFRYFVNGSSTRQMRRRDSGSGDKSVSSDAAFTNGVWETNVVACDGTVASFQLNNEDATSTSDLDVGATSSATTGKLGTNVAASNFYEGQLRRFYFDPQHLQGMAEAKMTRWTNHGAAGL